MQDLTGRFRIGAMPYRKINFYENGFYHVYNRGVEKRDIFLDENDYNSFLSILSAYLSNQRVKLQGRALRIGRHQLHEEIRLMAYCLMPNHFHFLIQQKSKNSITNLMRRILTAYSMYFNEKYARVGSLFQGRFKAKEVSTDEYLLHLSRYIHRNPFGSAVSNTNDLESFLWSSYPIYLNRFESRFISTDPILDFFTGDKSEKYKLFVEEETDDRLPKDILLDDE